MVTRDRRTVVGNSINEALERWDVIVTLALVLAVICHFIIS